MSLTSTPRSNRLHIGIYGKRNSGKSSLINALTGQKIALVSDVAGDVYKRQVVGVMKGCSIIRVHDVLENRRAALMTAAIMRG